MKFRLFLLILLLAAQQVRAAPTAATADDIHAAVADNIEQGEVKVEQTDDSRLQVKATDNEDEEQKILTPKYPVSIETDNDVLREMLETHLPLIVYQKKERLDREQVEFLAEDTPKNAIEMIRTEGYFNAQVSVSQQGEGYRVSVQAGPRTHVDNVGMMLGGDMLQDENLGDYYKNAFNNWALPVGTPFRQSDWSASKISALGAVTRKKYPLARFSQTEALINPQTQKADLTVNVDSGRPIYFGELSVSGVERYPESVVRGLAQFKPGDVYDLDKILDYQQALENDNHYSGASVQADFDNLTGDRVPVKVAVSEVKRQKIEAGLRFDSEYGLGGNFGYDHYNVFNRGYVGSAYIDYDKYQTTLAVGLSQPRRPSGHYLTGNLAYTRSTTQRLEKHAVSSGIWHVRDRGNIEARYGIEFISEQASIPERNIDLGRSYATMITASWRKQNITTPLRPANGYYFDGKIGATVGKLLSSATMARIKGSAGYYFTPEEKKIGTFIVRGELGYVYTNADDSATAVPSSLMFRSGGAASVRGYELDSIGRRLPNDNQTVLPDRAMYVFSGEYQYPIKKDFALAVFHDVGGVAQTFQSINARHGTGLGLRWFSPVAPFSFDIAYGHHDKKIRWHISLGTRF